MNLFFYLKTFILNYSFIVILSDLFFFVLCFIKTQPFVNRKPVKAEKKNTGTIAFRFRQVLLYLHVFVVFYVSLGWSPYRRAFLEECALECYYARLWYRWPVIIWRLALIL